MSLQDLKCLSHKATSEKQLLMDVLAKRPSRSATPDARGRVCGGQPPLPGLHAGWGAGAESNACTPAAVHAAPGLHALITPTRSGLSTSATVMVMQAVSLWFSPAFS